MLISPVENRPPPVDQAAADLILIIQSLAHSGPHSPGPGLANMYPSFIRNLAAKIFMSEAFKETKSASDVTLWCLTDLDPHITLTSKTGQNVRDISNKSLIWVQHTCCMTIRTLYDPIEGLIKITSDTGP